MTVTADSYESQVSAAGVTMLARSETFRTMATAANETAARAFIVEDDAGAGEDETAKKASDGSAISPSGTWAVIHAGPVQTESRAWYTYGRSGEMTFHVLRRITSSDTPAEVLRRARNEQGLIRGELESQFGSSGALVAGDFTSQDPVILEDIGAHKNHVLITLTLAWRDIP